MEPGEEIPRTKTPLGLRRVRYVQLDDADRRIVPVKVWERGFSSVLDIIEEMEESQGETDSSKSPSPVEELNQQGQLLKSKASSRIASPRARMIEVLPTICSRVSSPVLSISSSALDGRCSRNSISVGIGGSDLMAGLEITPRAQRSASMADIETCKVNEKGLPSEVSPPLSAPFRKTRNLARKDLDVQGFSEPPMPAAALSPLTSSEAQLTDAMLGFTTPGEGHMTHVSLDNRAQLTVMTVGINEGDACSASGESKRANSEKATNVKKVTFRKQISQIFRRISRPFRACFGRSLSQD